MNSADQKTAQHIREQAAQLDQEVRGLLHALLEERQSAITTAYRQGFAAGAASVPAPSATPSLLPAHGSLSSQSPPVEPDLT